MLLLPLAPSCILTRSIPRDRGCSPRSVAAYELGNTRDPSAFDGGLGIALMEATTAPPGVIIHS